jgi:multisubunit Na+/H+ antiporter MnhB subunit
MPLLSLALGAVLFAAFAIGGSPGEGAGGFAVMAAVAALFALGGRSETLRGLGGPGRDERWEMIDLRATAFAGLVAVAFVLGAWLWEVAHGDDGRPYALVAAAAGAGYVVAVVVLRRRS